MFDQSHDTKGPHKFQFLFSRPYVVEGGHKDSPNFYVLTDVKTGSTSSCNVDLLVPARQDCPDLGDPLGWPEVVNAGPAKRTTRSAAKRKRSEAPAQEEPAGGENADPPTALHPAVGDMVALEVAPDLLEKVPFAVGKVISTTGDQLVVWWYGNAHGNVLGAWRK
jgi:hypothetical protein